MWWPACQSCCGYWGSPGGTFTSHQNSCLWDCWGLSGSVDPPLVPRVDKRKGKNPTTTSSSAVKRRKTQVSSPTPGNEIAFNSANRSPPIEECQATIPIWSSAFRNPCEGIVPLESLYQHHEVDDISAQPHTSLVCHLVENMRVVTVFLFCCDFS